MTTAQGRVLYIDDDEALAHLVSRHLRREGFEVEVTTDGDAGLKLLDSNSYDAVALDHFMPGRMGMDILGSIQELSNPPPVIYVTAADEGRVAVAALRSGAVDYVIKSVDNEFMPLLAAAIRSAIAGRRTLRERERADEETRRARDKAEMLLREMNHRVANSLSLVASFVNLQANQTQDETARSALRDTHNRIIAVAQLHRSLYTTDNVATVKMNPYLGSLIEEIQRSQVAAPSESAIKSIVEDVMLPTDKAVSVGVIVSELVTNALKYAYPVGVNGEIRVSLRPANGDLQLTVEDDGVGLSPDKPQGTGLGMKIVRAMATTLAGDIQVDPALSGTKITICIPGVSTRES